MFIQKFRDSFKILPQKIKLSFFMMIFYSVLISIFEFFGIASIPLLFSTLLNLNENSSMDLFEKFNFNNIDKIKYRINFDFSWDNFFFKVLFIS